MPRIAQVSPGAAPRASWTASRQVVTRAQSVSSALDITYAWSPQIRDTTSSHAAAGCPLGQALAAQPPGEDVLPAQAHPPRWAASSASTDRSTSSRPVRQLLTDRRSPATPRQTVPLG